MNAINVIAPYKYRCMNRIYVNDVRVGFSARPLGLVIAIAWIGKRVGARLKRK